VAYGLVLAAVSALLQTTAQLFLLPHHLLLSSIQNRCLCCCRFCCCCRVPAGQLLHVWLADADWRKRHAALICLAQIAEGCEKLMGEQVEGLVGMCLTGLRDTHPKVRQSLINVLCCATSCCWPSPKR
jgi:hypothetical protein